MSTQKSPDQPSLFDDREMAPDLLVQGLPGLTYEGEFVSPFEAACLLARLEEVALSPFRFRGWDGKRLTASFGWRYDFTDASFTRGPRIPKWLEPLRERAARLVRKSSDDLAQVLITRYDPGAGIGWHRDRPVFEDVLGLSLGAPATLRMRRRRSDGFERVSVPLAPRSVYWLRGPARYDWEHSIAPMDQLRWSITFRTLRQEPGPR